MALNALLYKKFSLPVDTDHIVYHHWYDLNKGTRLNGKGATKSCPGTAFFGGNSVQAANLGFIPLIKNWLWAADGGALPVIAIEQVNSIGLGIVTASKLNVRKGPGASFGISSALSAGAMVNIFEEQTGWIKISANNEWITDRYIIRVTKAHVIANSLNARTGPDGFYPKIASLPKHTEVLVYEQKEGWARIDINDKWVYARYLEMD